MTCMQKVDCSKPYRDKPGILKLVMILLDNSWKCWNVNVRDDHLTNQRVIYIFFKNIQCPYLVYIDDAMFNLFRDDYFPLRTQFRSIRVKKAFSFTWDTVLTISSYVTEILLTGYKIPNEQLIVVFIDTK